MMLRTGIFGGSFNPVQRGHIRLSQWLVEQGFVDEIWLLVSPQNPLKDEAGLLDENERLEMARRAASDFDAIRASDFEFHLPRPSYTWRTLQALRRTYPEREFSLIIGADNWNCFRRWVRPDDILEHHHILVYPRPGYPVDRLSLPPHVRYVDAPVYDISATNIREALRLGDDTSDLLPPSVSQYIALKGLYSSAQET